MKKLVGRYIGKSRSGDKCSMMWPKLYSETSPIEGLKEGVAVGEEVGPEDGADVGSDDAEVEGQDDGTAVRYNDGTVEGRDDGAVEGLVNRAFGLY